MTIHYASDLTRYNKPCCGHTGLGIKISDKIDEVTCSRCKKIGEKLENEDQ